MQWLAARGREAGWWRRRNAVAAVQAGLGASYVGYICNDCLGVAAINSIGNEAFWLAAYCGTFVACWLS
jgi:hypothetical protein